MRLKLGYVTKIWIRRLQDRLIATLRIFFILRIKSTMTSRRMLNPSDQRACPDEGNSLSIQVAGDEYAAQSFMDRTANTKSFLWKGLQGMDQRRFKCGSIGDASSRLTSLYTIITFLRSWASMRNASRERNMVSWQDSQVLRSPETSKGLRTCARWRWFRILRQRLSRMPSTLLFVRCDPLGVEYFRYADDIYIIVPHVAVEDTKELQQLELERNDAKGAAEFQPEALPSELGQLGLAHDAWLAACLIYARVITDFERRHEYCNSPNAS